MTSVAILSLHTSPLAQPGSGDGGGMNVYVRELSSALTRAGIACEVFTRAWAPGLPSSVEVEPGFRVHHVEAGPASTWWTRNPGSTSTTGSRPLRHERV